MLIFYTINSFGQFSADCRTAVPICSDNPILSLSDGSGDVDDFDPDVITQSGCLEKGSIASQNIENNSGWYVFRANTTGQLGFDLQALPIAGNAVVTAEYDFALYGPFTSADTGTEICMLISSGSEPIRCNYENNNTRFTGMGINPENGMVGGIPTVGSANTYDSYLNVIEGEVYYLFINNFNDNISNDEEPSKALLSQEK